MVNRSNFPFLSRQWWDERARLINRANAGTYYVAKCPACQEWRVQGMCKCDLRQYEVDVNTYHTLHDKLEGNW